MICPHCDSDDVDVVGVDLCKCWNCGQYFEDEAQDFNDELHFEKFKHRKRRLVEDITTDDEEY